MGFSDTVMHGTIGGILPIARNRADREFTGREWLGE